MRQSAHMWARGRTALIVTLATVLTTPAAGAAAFPHGPGGVRDMPSAALSDTLPAAVRDTLPAARRASASLVPSHPPAERGLFRSSDLVWAGVFAGGLLLVEPAERAEEAIARATRNGRGFHEAVGSIGEVAGHGFMAYGLATGTFLVGTLADEPAVARVGLRSLESLALATATTASLKFALGRERPVYSPDESDEFRPFELALERSSFPSGHTAHLFALAGTVSHELSDEAGWLPYVVYPVAGLVGLSRVMGQKHWVTDVVSGAAIGVLSSRLVGRLHTTADGPVGGMHPIIRPLERGGFVAGLSVELR